MKNAAHWTVILMTRGQARADEIISLLKAEGFMARARQMSRAMSGEENDFEITCLDSEAREAHQFLIEHGFYM